MFKFIKHHVWLLMGALFLVAATVTTLTYPARVPVTGANPSTYGGGTYTVVTGEDVGTSGVAWPNPRFIINDNNTPADETDDTVVDVLTGLEWLRDANSMQTTGYKATGLATWAETFTYIDKLNSGDYGTKNGGYDDWRMPSVREMQSIISYGLYNPAVPNTAGTGKCVANVATGGDPFNNLRVSIYYWVSTIESSVYKTYSATPNLISGEIYYVLKSSSAPVMLVRGGGVGGSGGGNVSSVVSADTAKVTAITCTEQLASPSYLQTNYGVETTRELIGDKIKKFSSTCVANTLGKFKLSFTGISGAVSSVSLLKLKTGTYKHYINVYSSSAAASGNYYITDSSDTVILAGAALSASKEYNVYFYIQDNDGDYDTNAAAGIIDDPTGLFVIPSSSVTPGAAGEDDWSVQSCELSRGASVVGLLPIMFALGLLWLLSRRSKSSK